MITSKENMRQLIQDLTPVLTDDEEVAEVAKGMAIVNRLGTATYRRRTPFITNYEWEYLPKRWVAMILRTLPLAC